MGNRLFSLFRLCLYLLASCLLLESCSSNLFYIPRRYAEPETLKLLEQEEIVKLPYHIEGSAQTAFFLKPIGPVQSVWLLFGGINSLALDWHQWFYRKDSGRALLLVDYPGYGLNHGTPRAEKMFLSSRAAFDSLACHLGTTEAELAQKTGVLGHSLGTGVALNFAKKVKVKKVLLIAPFTSLHELAIYRYGKVKGFFLNLINPEKYENSTNLALIAAQTPPPEIVVVHGAMDTVIPAAMGRYLAAISPQLIRYHEIEAIGHQDFFLRHGDFIRTLMNFDNLAKTP